ncbi:MAG TPA: hypothetical protein VN678_12605, partial [Acidobacteriaceae bacterium]|nr:hypothetical protein [Acidobacteriaceae bacterium]
QRVSEHLADAGVVSFAWEGMGEQGIKIAVQAESFDFGTTKSGGDEETGQFFRRQGAGVGGVAQVLDAIESIGFGGFRRAVGYDDASAATADADHFAQSGQRVRQVMESEAAAHDVEVAVGVGQAGYVPCVPGEIREALLGLSFAGLVEHGRGEINTGGVAGDASEGAGKNAGSAGYVEDGVFRPGLRCADNALEKSFIASALSPGEAFGLARELVDNFRVMVHFNQPRG